MSAKGGLLMNTIKFVVCDGNWIHSNILPENSAAQYYVVTMCHQESKFNVLMEKYFRYYHNHWEYYENGEWNSSWNPVYRVVAYQKLSNLEAAAYEDFH